MSPAIIYIVICLVCAMFGMGTKLGFWGTLLMSIFLTPLVSMLVLLIMERLKK